MKKVAYVKWVDSAEYKKKKIGDHTPPVEVENGGLLIEDEPEYVVLAFYKNHSEEIVEPSVSIPRCSIKKITIFDYD